MCRYWQPEGQGCRERTFSQLSQKGPNGSRHANDVAQQVAPSLEAYEYIGGLTASISGKAVAETTLNPKPSRKRVADQGVCAAYAIDRLRSAQPSPVVRMKLQPRLLVKGRWLQIEPMQHLKKMRRSFAKEPQQAETPQL